MRIKTCFSQKQLDHFYQILFVSFKAHGKENLLTYCWSHDQDGRHANIYGKKFLPFSQWNDFNEIWYMVSETPSYQSLFRLIPWVDLDLFFRQGQILKLRHFYRKL